MTVNDLLLALTNLPGDMRIVTPDFEDIYFVVESLGHDVHIGIITDVPVPEWSDKAREHIIEPDSVHDEPYGFDPIGSYYTREDESY